MATPTRLTIKYRKTSELIPYARNARTHTHEQIAQIAASIKEFGFTNPILLSSASDVVAGHGRLLAAQLLKMGEVPTIELGHLSETQRRAYVIADNKLALNAGWDTELLGLELMELGDADFDLDLLGFDEDELESLLNPEVAPADGLTDPDTVPENVETRCKPGDLWVLGDHRLLCGDSTNVLEQRRLTAGAVIDMVFTDPPYGIGGYAGRGKDSRRPVAGDDLDPRDFYQSIPDAAEVYVWGMVANIKDINFEPRDVIVWRKNNIGMGRGYRGQYEVCFYKGIFSGSDSDVWDVSKDRNYVHPTQKPVELAERAIKNSDPMTVMDIFSGSGSTLIACERTGRQCFAMELEPHYCDVIIARWEQFTGLQARRLDGEV